MIFIREKIFNSKDCLDIIILSVKLKTKWISFALRFMGKLDKRIVKVKQNFVVLNTYLYTLIVRPFVHCKIIKLTYITSHKIDDLSHSST